MEVGSNVASSPRLSTAVHWVVVGQAMALTLMLVPTPSRSWLTTLDGCA